MLILLLTLLVVFMSMSASVRGPSRLRLSIASKSKRKECVCCGVFVALNESHKTEYDESETIAEGSRLTVDSCVDLAIYHYVICERSNECICDGCSKKPISDLTFQNTLNVSDLKSDQKIFLHTYSSVLIGVIREKPPHSESESSQSTLVQIRKERRDTFLRSLTESDYVILTSKTRTWVLGLKQSHLLLYLTSLVQDTTDSFSGVIFGWSERHVGRILGQV